MRLPAGKKNLLRLKTIDFSIGPVTQRLYLTRVEPCVPVDPQVVIQRHIAFRDLVADGTELADLLSRVVSVPDANVQLLTALMDVA